MTDLARILAKNIHNGSGKHGLPEDHLYEVFKSCNDITMLAYTLKKCVEHSGTDAFHTQELSFTKPTFTSFTSWHHIDEPYNSNWGFNKSDPGCYIYGVYSTPPAGPANFLDSSVIYIGESRATTRGCMLGRRKDFSCGVKNDWVSPMGNSQKFIEVFGKDKIKDVYQAYLPMHPSLCKSVELELLALYYKQHNNVPVCNPIKDYNRVVKIMKEEKWQALLNILQKTDTKQSGT